MRVPVPSGASVKTCSYVPVASLALNAKRVVGTDSVTASVARNSLPFDRATDSYVSPVAVTVSGSADHSPCRVRSATNGQTRSGGATASAVAAYDGMRRTVREAVTRRPLARSYG